MRRPIPQGALPPFRGSTFTAGEPAMGKRVFRVPTYLSRSSIHGLGVFTPVFIPAGTLIWNLDPDVDWVLGEADIDRFPEAYREKIRSYCYLEESGSYILCGDNARFMNHSDDPNCDDWTSSSTLAHRDIEPGEELTCDYRAFDVASRDDRAEPYIRRSA
jgi:SET domain-containing protein